MSKGQLILIPSALSQNKPRQFLPERSLEWIFDLSHFIAERSKTARQFLKSLDYPKPMSEIEVVELHKHQEEDYNDLLQPCLDGINVGLLSEAGVPGVADPGGGVVRAAHDLGIEVVPLIGPSSLLLALMASGMNGQKFTFHGYLPKDDKALHKALNQMEADSRRENTTHMFIETPFRNQKLHASLLKILSPETWLSISVELTSNNEVNRSKTIREWQKTKINLDKKPAVFLVYSGEKVK
jgi:16S rRNA (cytidine1402-2'-O)-methyltransferase